MTDECFSRVVLLNLGQFYLLPRTHVSMSGVILGHHSKGSALVEARGAVKDPPMHRTALPNKEFPDPKRQQD